MPFTTGEPVPITPAEVKYADTWALDTLEVRVSAPSATAAFNVYYKGELVDVVRGVAAGSDLENNPDVVRLFGELEGAAFAIMQALGKVPKNAVRITEPPIEPEKPAEENNNGTGS